MSLVEIVRIRVTTAVQDLLDANDANLSESNRVA